MLISIVTPTARRPSFLPLLYDVIRAQTWVQWEWLVLDGSEQPWGPPDDPRVRYLHEPAPLSIGEKRNRLAEAARGDLIAHFDDDDYYAPGYLATMVQRLGDAALAKLTGFFCYRAEDRQLAHWDLMRREGLHHEWQARRPVAERTFGPADAESLRDLHLGFGFSFLYRRAAWAASPFPDVGFDEDGAFTRALMRQAPIVGFNDTQGLALAVQHVGNRAKLFPNTLLPPEAMTRVFPNAAEHLRRLHALVS